METREIEFALIGRPDSPPPGPVEPYEWEIPWAERRRTVVAVPVTESLAFAMEQATRELGVQPWEGPLTPLQTIGWIAFADDESTKPLYQRKLDSLVLVDDDGRAVWASDFWAVPIGQLFASAEAGTIPGDPARIHLIRQIPQGDFFGVEWAQLLQLWEVGWDVLERVDTLLGAGAAGAYAAKKLQARRAKKALGESRAAADKALAGWMRRNGTPSAIVALLRTRPWRAAEVARLLDVSEEQARGLLELLGFDEGEDGRFHRRETTTDLLSRLDREFERAAERAMMTGFSPAVLEWSRDRIERTIATDEDLPVDPIDFGDYGFPPTTDAEAEWQPTAEQTDEDEFIGVPGHVVVHEGVLLAAWLSLAGILVILGLLVALLVDGGSLKRAGAGLAATLGALALVALTLVLAARKRTREHNEEESPN